jgi:hypothetical protein
MGQNKLRRLVLSLVLGAVIPRDLRQNCLVHFLAEHHRHDSYRETCYPTAHWTVLTYSKKHYLTRFWSEFYCFVINASIIYCWRLGADSCWYYSEVGSGKCIQLLEWTCYTLHVWVDEVNITVFRLVEVLFLLEYGTPSLGYVCPPFWDHYGTHYPVVWYHVPEKQRPQTYKDIAYILLIT